MSDKDPLLQFMSADASSEQPLSKTGYKISVVVGGNRFTGHVVHPDAFLEDSLTKELEERYREGRDASRDASEYLHLIASDGPDWSATTNRHVRFRMDGIAAWWAE